ncbi:E3 ubiquitin-protein ligase SDIR1 [Cinnamomum micranthum f. kanehirae]|uniref:E3 ubiquitin-protein ligase SDIR1 n=1 Tax=Cinnamomum micranthum f. kanehirae TaxID=337451 RepID=A0A443NLJ4_9MAGN|nr:E3 ubiquitin-protein ligase SDIR1 [Cinnamomum micranthum f. kanehirae]
MGSTHHRTLDPASQAAMRMHAQEEEIKVTIKYKVEEIKTLNLIDPSVNGGATDSEVFRREIFNSHVDFSTCTCNLLSPHGSEWFVINTLSLLRVIPSAMVQHLRTTLAQEVNSAARIALERRCNWNVYQEIKIATNEYWLSGGERENLNEQTGGFGAVPATDDQITKGLETKIFKKDMENGYDDCAICLEEFVDDSQVNQLPCRHSFHGPCIVKWLKESNCCPICRYRLQPKS